MAKVQCVRCCKVCKHYELTKNWICVNMVDVAIMSGVPGEYRPVQIDRPYHFCSPECAGLWLYRKIVISSFHARKNFKTVNYFYTDKIIQVPKWKKRIKN